MRRVVSAAGRTPLGVLSPPVSADRKAASETICDRGSARAHTEKEAASNRDV